MDTITRWVCAACGAIWFQPQEGRCPQCHGAGAFRACEVLPNGELKPVDVNA